MSTNKIKVFSPNPAQGMNLGQLAQQAQNQSGSTYNQYAQMSMHPQYAAQQSPYNISRDAWIDQRYMIDGNYMTLQEFVDFIWPEDCPERTFFILKHTKETNNVESRK
jgi:hypothetical protein